MPENIIKDRSILNLFTREQVIANFLMLVVILLWGVSFISIKIAVTEIPPITMALIRFAIASLLLVIILRRVEPGTKVEKKDILLLSLGGMLGITLYFFFENIGVKLSTATNASLIVTTIPIIAIILELLFFPSNLSMLKVVGVGIAIVGTYLSVTANGEMEFNSKNFIGNLFMLGAMLSWALYTLVNKNLQVKYSGLFLTTYQTVIGTVCLAPLSMVEYAQWQPFSLTAFVHVLFLAICCSVICYLLYMYVLKHLDVVITTLYLNLVPVVGVVSGYLVLNESVLPIQIFGGLLTLLAILIVNWDQIIQGKKYKVI